MTDKPLVLTVDDDAAIRETIQDYLGLHGIAVVTADGGEAMRARVAERRPDIVILDLNMPGENGLTLARWLRDNTTCGIIMLTAVADPIDRVVGLEVGADDYMAKPFLPRELLARVRTLLRRVSPPADAQAAPAPALPAGAPTGTRVRFGRCWLDLDSGKLITEAREEQLTGMEFDLLKAFAAHPNKILSRDALLSLAHNRDWDPFDRSIDVRITRIRKKIEPDPAHPQVIRTVRGAGYIFEPAKD